MDAHKAAEERVRRARSLLDWNRPFAARRAIDGALAIDPGGVSARAMKMSFDIRYGRADVGAAVSGLEALVREHPDSLQAKASLGDGLHWTGYHLKRGDDRTERGLEIMRVVADEQPTPTDGVGLRAAVSRPGE